MKILNPSVYKYFMFYIMIVVLHYRQSFLKDGRMGCFYRKKSSKSVHSINLDSHVSLSPSTFTGSNFESSTLSQSMSCTKPDKAMNSIYIVVLQLQFIKFWI